MSVREDRPVAEAAPLRLARYLAACGVASRRACEELIRGGKVHVNGALVQTPAVTVVPGRDQVRCRGVTAVLRTPACLVLNKPRGVTCSARDVHARRLVGDLVPAQFGRLFTVGRLDRDSEGLILLTNDGALAQRLAHPTGAVERTYHVEVRGTVGEGVLGRLRGGIEDAGEFLRPLAVTVAQRSRDGAVLRFVLRTGRKREVRRLCRAAGLAVLVLRRVQFGPLCLGDLQPGQWRELSSAELAALRGAAGSPPRRLAGSRWRWPRNRSVNSVA